MTVATYDVVTLVVKGRNGYGHAECLLAKARQLGCDFVGLQKARRPRKTEFSAAGYRIFCSGKEETGGRQGQYEVGLAVKELICLKSVYTHQLIDERLVSMRFELTGESVAVNLVGVYASTEPNLDTKMQEEFWEQLGRMVEQIPMKECLFELVDAHARTEKRVEGCRDGRVLGAQP